MTNIIGYVEINQIIMMMMMSIIFISTGGCVSTTTVFHLFINFFFRDDHLNIFEHYAQHLLYCYQSKRRK